MAALLIPRCGCICLVLFSLDQVFLDFRAKTACASFDLGEDSVADLAGGGKMR